MLVFGIILIVIGIILIFLQISKKKSLFTVQAIPKRKASEIKELANQVAKEIGPGSFNDNARLYGTIGSINPITSELAEVKCVFYSMRISRKYEEERKRENKETGETETYWETCEETVSSNSRQTDFYIDDGSGKIAGTFTDCSYDTEKVLDKFEPYQSGRQITIGNFNLDLDDSTSYAGRRNLGYQIEEYAIPIGKKALIVGMVTDNTGELKFRQPKEDRYKYLLSFKDEAEFIESAKGTIKMMQYGYIIAFIAGVVLIILSFFQ